MAKSTKPSPVDKSDLGYRIKNLRPAEQMPIVLNGNEFDLANLSPEDLDYLLGFPEEAPYLERINDNNQATGA